MNEELFREMAKRLIAVEKKINFLEQALCEAGEEHEYNTGLEDFRNKYPEINTVDGGMKVLFGDEYDTYKDIFDQSRGCEDVDAFVADALRDISEKLGHVAELQAQKAEGDGTESTLVVEDVAPEESEGFDEETLAKALTEAKGL